MITIERHPNLDNWIEVRYFGKLLDQFTSTIKAHKFASQQATKKKTRVFNFDKGAKNGGWSFSYGGNCFTYFCISNKMKTIIIIFTIGQFAVGGMLAGGILKAHAERQAELEKLRVSISSCFE